MFGKFLFPKDLGLHWSDSFSFFLPRFSVSFVDPKGYSFMS